MKHELDRAHEKQTGKKELEFLSRLRLVVTPKTKEAKREWFLSLLKSRYGYTNEKAVDDLSRILAQFDIVNRSHRLRMVSNNPLKT